MTPKPTKTADMLRLRREELRISQAELGKTVGRSEKSVRNWESGVYMPDRLTLDAWAEALGMKVLVVLEEVRGD